MAILIRGRPTSADAFVLALVAATALRVLHPTLLTRPAVSAWTTVFVAVCVQAAPYLVLGVVVSAVLAVWLPAGFIARMLPARAALAVPVAGAAGAALVGCECGSVPVGATLARRGVPAGAAVAFLLSAPAINPVVVVATAAAYPGRPLVVLARVLASFGTALVVGWVWTRFGVPLHRGRTHDHRPADGGSRLRAAGDVARHEFGRSFGLLVIGAAGAATVTTAVPVGWLDPLAASPWVGVLALGGLAVIVAVCSEADAFVASSLTRFSLTAQLAFMVVGPAVDLKLIAMQVGTFGPRVALRLAPLTFVVTVASAAAVGFGLLR